YSDVVDDSKLDNPTRRPSDLDETEARLLAASTLGGIWGGFGLTIRLTRNMAPDPRFAGGVADSIALAPTMIGDGPGLVAGGQPRSEEHTSELQSRENLVCRLL